MHGLQRGTKEEAECAICQEDLAEHTATQLPCSHVFHRDCVQQWLLRKASCPTCAKAISAWICLYQSCRRIHTWLDLPLRTMPRHTNMANAAHGRVTSEAISAQCCPVLRPDVGKA